MFQSIKGPWPTQSGRIYMRMAEAVAVSVSVHGDIESGLSAPDEPRKLLKKDGRRSKWRARKLHCN
jgi:hypothetical protein